MVVRLMTIKLYAPWVNSLKEKRMVVKSLCEKVQHKFRVSIIESDAQDILKTIVISICFLANTASLATSVGQRVIQFIEANTDAEILDIFEENR